MNSFDKLDFWGLLAAGFMGLSTAFVKTLGLKNRVVALEQCKVDQKELTALTKLHDERHENIKALITELKDDMRLNTKKLDSILINVSRRRDDLKTEIQN